MMSDEGIGVHVVRELNKSADLCPNSDFVEAGSSMMGIVHSIRRRKKAVLIDCAYMDEKPGAIRKFSPAAVASRTIHSARSAHKGGLFEVLRLSRYLGEYPDRVVIFGIQPGCVMVGDRLSQKLVERMDDYVRVIVSELEA